MNALELQDLISLMAELRDPQHGCPWDRKQTARSLARFCIEEAYEVESAAQQAAEGDWRELKSELGDLWFQVLFFSQLANEQGEFDLREVLQTLHDKLLSRHPHVWPDGTRSSFGQPNPMTDSQIHAQWEAIKQRERQGRGQAGALHDVPDTLPALERAQKLQSRAARVGFDWPDASGVRDKVDEEIAEYDAAVSPAEKAEELGDLLFTLVNLARKEGFDAATLLRDANRKFERRFQAMEALDDLESLSSEQLEQLWISIKQH